MLSRFANIVLLGVRVRVSVKRTFTGPTTLNFAYKLYFLQQRFRKSIARGSKTILPMGLLNRCLIIFILSFHTLKRFFSNHDESLNYFNLPTRSQEPSYLVIGILSTHSHG